MKEEVLAASVLISLLVFFVCVWVVWLIIRAGVAAGVKKDLVRQNELIFDQLDLQTTLLRGIAQSLQSRPTKRGEIDDDLPPPPAARATR